MKLGRSGDGPWDWALTDEVFGLQFAPQVRDPWLVDSDNGDMDDMADAGRIRLL
jgi:hypothetical protein